MKPRDPHRRFREAVRRAGGAARVAELLTCSRQYIYDLMNDQIPGLDFALRIRDRFGISVDDWGASVDSTRKAVRA